MAFLGLATTQDLNNAVATLNKTINAAVATLNKRINMAQSDVDAITAELQTVAADVAKVASDLDSSTQTLQAEIDSLANANPALDLTALKAAADALDPSVQAVDAQAQKIGQLTPTPPPAP